MSWFGLILARRAVGQHLGYLAETAARSGLTVQSWRSLLTKAAQNGDLDHIFEVHVDRAEQKARDYIRGKRGAKALD